MVKAKSFNIGNIGNTGNTFQSPRNKSYLALIATASAMLSLVSITSWADPLSNDGKSDDTQQMSNATMTQYDRDANPSGTGSSPSSYSNGSGQNGSKPSQGNGTKKTRKGQCKASEAISGTYECDTTYNFIEKAELTNTLSQAAGSAFVNGSGQVANMRAQSAGTQSAVMEAAASQQQNAGMLQTTVGIANAAMGAYQIKLSRQHKNNGQAISERQGSDTAPVNGAPKLNYEEAMNEQQKVEKDAMHSGVLSVIKGVQQTISGALAIGAANQAKQLAGKLSDTTGSSYQLTSTNPDTSALNPTTTTSINPGTSTDPAVAATDGNINKGDVPSISPPVNPDSAAGGPGAGPAAGSFQAGNNKGGGGSAGNPGIGVGSMSPAKADQEQTGPRMAENKANTTYGQAGGYAAAGGVSAEKSADLGFLANLLPKPQEEMGKNGILDYGGGRSPASVAPYSFLGKDVNIFQRISDRTTAKLKSGDLKSDLGG
jgi:hypothetical protein